MNLLGTVLNIVAALPALIAGVEKLFGRNAGEQKKHVVINTIKMAAELGGAIAGKDVVDPAGFEEGLNQAINGTVKILNASAWHETET